jgi:hypothetical protein
VGGDGALDQIVTARVDGGAQRISDDLQVGDLLFDLCQLRLSPGPETGVRWSTVMVARVLEKVGHLVQGEAEALGGLDHPKDSHGLRRIQPVPAEAAVRLAKQTAPLVVTQCLEVDPGGGRNFAAAQARRSCRGHPGGSPGGKRVQDHRLGGWHLYIDVHPVAISGEVEREERTAGRLSRRQVASRLLDPGIQCPPQHRRRQALLSRQTRGEQRVELGQPQRPLRERQCAGLKNLNLSDVRHATTVNLYPSAGCKSFERVTAELCEL